MKAPAIIERLGHVGIVGLGLLLFGASFYFGSVRPLQEERYTLMSERASLRAEVARVRAASGADGVGLPPPLSEAPELLRKFSELAARYGITSGNASYQYHVAVGGQVLEVTVPLKANYLNLRAWLHEALSLPAPATLNEFVLQRSSAADPEIEAQVRISYAFQGSS